jgi:hypothetical protein
VTNPTVRSPLNPLQAAMVTMMKADATLTTLIAGRVFDEANPSETRDYVVVGDHLSTPDNTHDRYGREVTVTLHVWTKTPGAKRGQTIANAIIALFDHQPAALSAATAGHDVVSVRNIFDQAMRDPDPEWRHHVLRFRIQTAQED